MNGSDDKEKFKISFLSTSNEEKCIRRSLVAVNAANSQQ